MGVIEETGSVSLARKSSLDDLPLELKMLILEYMPPSGIINLRKTNKSFSDTSRKRSVWVAALRGVCEILGLFSSSFPLQDLTQKELEYIALSPERFASIFSSRVPEEELQAQIVSARSKIIEGLEVNTGSSPQLGAVFLCLHFVHGGRFLIISTSVSIDVWDLGLHITELPKFKLLASMTVQSVPECLCHVSSTLDGLGLTIITYDECGEEMRLAAYAVYPLATNAAFSRIASITIPNVYPNAWAAAGASLAFLHSSSVTVWNYESNLFVSWDHDIPNVIEVFLLKEHIVLINHLNIYLCEIPPPSSSTGDGRLSRTKTSIALMKSYRHPHGIYEDLTIPSSDWYSHQDDVIHFSVLACNEQYLDHYAITYPQRSREPEIQFLGSASLPRSVDEITLACIGANCSIIAINDTKTISVLLSPICGDHDGDQGSAAKQVEIWKVDGDVEIIELSICTATGRLVLLTTDGKFHVVDYLGPKYRCDSEKSLVQ